jgi:MEMO1 family protein
MSTLVREPAVAGQFYPGKRETLLRDIARFTEEPREKIRAIGCVVPHAGYMYSGHVAGAVYAKLQLPPRYIILCPNHTGMGEPLAIMSEGRWATPLGEVGIDSELASSLKSAMPLVHEDTVAHRSEHALEVQLPFLQKLVPDFTFVPLTVGTGNFEALSALGVSIAKVIAAAGESVMVIASSDMNHYESDEITRVKDAIAIERVLALDPRGLYDAVKREHISMCGYGPTVAMLTAARRLGASSAELIRYATSGDVSGERNAVVGYAGIVVK